MIKWYRVFMIRLRQSASSKWSLLILFLLAFSDASFLPLPVTTYFLVILLLNKEKSNKNILFVILGTVSGAVVGYSFGRYALITINGDFTEMGKFLFTNIPGFSESLYDKMQMLFSKWNVLILFGATVTPIPYGIFSVFSGAFKINFTVFLIASLLGQGLKFYLLAISTLKLDIYLHKLRRFGTKPVSLVTSAISGAIIFISTLIRNLL